MRVRGSLQVIGRHRIPGDNDLAALIGICLLKSIGELPDAAGKGEPKPGRLVALQLMPDRRPTNDTGSQDDSNAGDRTSNALRHRHRLREIAGALQPFGHLTADPAKADRREHDHHQRRCVHIADINHSEGQQADRQ